jgi:hypothetical protein
VVEESELIGNNRVRLGQIAQLVEQWTENPVQGNTTDEKSNTSEATPNSLPAGLPPKIQIDRDLQQLIIQLINAGPTLTMAKRRAIRGIVLVK